MTVRKSAVSICVSGVAFDSFAKTPSALNMPCAAMQAKRLLVLQYIITNIKPATVA